MKIFLVRSLDGFMAGDLKGPMFHGAYDSATVAKQVMEDHCQSCFQKVIEDGYSASARHILWSDIKSIFRESEGSGITKFAIGSIAEVIKVFRHVDGWTPDTMGVIWAEIIDLNSNPLLALAEQAE